MHHACESFISQGAQRRLGMQGMADITKILEEYGGRFHLTVDPPPEPDDRRNPRAPLFGDPCRDLAEQFAGGVPGGIVWD